VVEVKQHHIDASLERSSSHCAFAMALKEAIPHARFISIDIQSCRWTDPIKGVRYVALTPHAVRDLILAFDQGEREKLCPCTVRLKPSFVTRTGVHRRHTPINEQLVDAGLKVAEDPVPTAGEAALAQVWKP
jgi:hypothetical protein